MQNDLILPEDHPVWIPCVQGSDEWKQQRLGAVTGSRFGDVMTKGRAGEPFGKTAQTYALDICIEKITGVPRDDIKVKEMEWGRDHEGGARLAYCLMSGQKVDQVGFARHGKYRQIGLSVDGLVGTGGTIEIKCPFNSKYHLLNLLHRRVPTEYKWQVQGGLWILKRRFCDFISYDPRMKPHLRLAVTRVYRDEEMIEELEAKCLKFLDYIKEHEEKIETAAEEVKAFLDSPEQKKIEDGRGD